MLTILLICTCVFLIAVAVAKSIAADELGKKLQHCRGVRDGLLSVADQRESRIAALSQRVEELEGINEKLMLQRAAVKAAMPDIGGLDVPEVRNEPPFAIGDKVEVLSDYYKLSDPGARLYVKGRIVNVVDIDDESDVHVLADGDEGGTTWFKPSELRKVG